MTESTNEQILTDLIECLRDQIAELTLRLDEANALNKRLTQSFMAGGAYIEIEATSEGFYVNET